MVFDIVVGRNESDMKKFGKEGTIFLGRSYVKMGQYTSLSNNLYMDVLRSHVIYVAGKRGSGKCLHGDTLIQLEDGRQIKISDLKDNNQKVCGLNDELKIQKLRKKDFFQRKADDLIRLKLRSGKEIKLTSEHPLLTLKGWVPVKNLTAGSRIATPRKINCFGDKSMSIYKIKLLSYLIAEGHTKKIVLFSNSDPAIIQDFRNSLEQFDKNLKLVKEEKYHYRIAHKHWRTKVVSLDGIKRDKFGRFGKGSKIEIKKRSIRVFLEETGIFNLLSIKKQLSGGIMQLKKNDVKLFLNRLFSCDGSIYNTNDNWQISYSSSSEKLIRQVQHLLLRFGILSKLRKKKIKLNGKIFDSFELVLYGIHVIKYIKEIGFFGKKEERAKKAIEDSIVLTRNPNVDTIPKEIWDIFRPKNWEQIGKKMNYAIPKALRESIRYSPSREKLLQIAVEDSNEQIKMLAESDIFWDEVVELSRMKGEFTVYDISVPQFHNFIANDILVHNSYSLGVIAEGMSLLPKKVSKNIACIMLDTMGIFWTMKYKNEKDFELLNQWGLNPQSVNVKIYTPLGYFDKYKKEGIPTDFAFSIAPKELTAEDWRLTFELEKNNPVAVIIERIINTFQEDNVNYSLNDIIDAVRKEKMGNETQMAALNLLENAKNWGLFSERSTPMRELVKGGEISIIDISCYSGGKGGWGVKGLVVGLLAKRIFQERMESRKEEEYESIESGESFFTEETEKEGLPQAWIFIDEAHEFLPKKGKSAATDALITVLREGRQPGVSLVLATQQPGKIHDDVMTQSDIVISHVVTAKADVEALNSMNQSYLVSDLVTYLNDLPKEKGAGLLLDDNSERIYPLRVRPRFTWHGGESPLALKKEKKLELDF